MRLTVLQQQTKALQAKRPDKEAAALSKQIESIKHLLWHGNVDEALDRMADMLLDLDLIRRHSAPADKLAAGIADLRDLHPEQPGIHPELRGAVPAGRDDQHGVCGVDDQSGGEPPVREETTDAVDAERSAPVLQTRTKVLNNELEDVFRRWYPQFRTEEKAAA